MRNNWKKVCIKNGKVYDPKNGIEGEKKDIFVEDGKIVEETKAKPEVVIDASGKIVMPGGIDVHSHVATYGLNLARFTLGFPTVKEIGCTYAKMGYTHVNEPLMTLSTAAYVHHELSSIPFVDTSSLLILNLNDVDKEIRSGDKEEMKNIILFLLDLTKSIGVKVYDVGVRYAKKGFFYRDIGIKRCLDFLEETAKLAEEEFPRVQLRTYPELLDENLDVLSAFHLAHIASGINNEERYEKAKKILRKGGFADIGISSTVIIAVGDINMRIGYDIPPEGSFISMDIGLEKPLIFSKIEKRKEKGEGDVEMYYSTKLALESINSLKSKSCYISFSTDSPNGCLFCYYPQIFSLLLSKSSRKEIFPKEITEKLPNVEYSLYELAMITRSNPARLLQLKNKGHLGVGADADIAIYDIEERGINKRKELVRKFGNCEYLLKGGGVVIYEGRIQEKGVGKKTFYFKPKEKKIPKEEVERISKKICGKKSFRMEHLRVDECFTGSTQSVC